jgi:acyl carrier protein
MQIANGLSANHEQEGNFLARLLEFLPAILFELSQASLGGDGMKQDLISETMVREEVMDAIAQTLRIDKDSVQADHSLMKDLGAESLDFLDINYRLEQTFGIKIARHFVLEHIEEMFGEGSAIDEDSQLTEKAIALLKIRLGDNLPVELRPGMDMDEIPPLVTVQGMVGVVMDILDTLPENCGSCGYSAWKVENSTRVKCGSCGAEATFTDGDTLTKEWLAKVQEEKKIF